jgi:hypothetical protein
MRAHPLADPIAWGARVGLILALLGGGGCGDKHPAAPMAQAAPAPALVEPPAPVEQTCGTQGMPDCPLQRWMDHQLSGPLSRDEYPVLTRSFRDLAAAAPTGFSGWSAWAQGGAVAAERQDDAGVRKACTGCHDGYRERYRRTLRERPMPAADPP